MAALGAGGKGRRRGSFGSWRVESMVLFVGSPGNFLFPDSLLQVGSLHPFSASRLSERSVAPWELSGPSHVGPLPDVLVP